MAERLCDLKNHLVPDMLISALHILLPSVLIPLCGVKTIQVFVFVLASCSNQPRRLCRRGHLTTTLNNIIFVSLRPSEKRCKTGYSFSR